MPRSVAFTPDDTRNWGLPLAGPGLLLDVPHEEHWQRRPSLHFEAASPYRLRLMSDGQPLLWVRIDSYWDQCGILRGPAKAPWVLPAVTAPEVRDIPHEPGADRWWEAWTWRLARVLTESSHPLLYAGRWCLRPVQAIDVRKADRYPISPMEVSVGENPVSPHSLDGISRFEPFWTEGWGYEELKQGAVLPLRAPSPEDDGRVKSWRKRARDRTLPPALLLYVEILGKWLVLDGHDRLHAALLEGVTPPLLGLWPVLEVTDASSKVTQEGALFAAEMNLRAGETPERIDRVNRMLVYSFAGPRRGTITRSWSLRGGLEAWRAEVLAWRKWNPFPAEPSSWEWFVAPD